MIGLFGVLCLVGVVLILPGWLWRGRRNLHDASLLFLPVVGLGVWFLLTSLRIGAQSLSNLSETVGVVAGAVIISYMKLFLFDRIVKTEKRSMFIAFALVVAVALAFRLLTPQFPE